MVKWSLLSSSVRSLCLFRRIRKRRKGKPGSQLRRRKPTRKKLSPDRHRVEHKKSLPFASNEYLSPVQAQIGLSYGEEKDLHEVST